MARTNRRREPGEVVNPNRGIKKNQRRTSRKSTKKKIQEIDYTNPDAWDEYEEEENISRGND
jgi:hypothetical protein